MTNTIGTVVAWIVSTFLLGSFPSGYVLTRLFKGVDVRQYGSGNTGATNVYRVAGLVPALLTFLLDALKGFIPVMLASSYFWQDYQFIPVIVGVSAIMRHIWSVFLRFRGGKGVATACGVFLAVLPVPVVYALLSFALVLGVTRYVSLGSIVAAVILPVSAWLRHEPSGLVVIAGVIAIAIIYRHKANIGRLVSGKENKLGATKTSGTSI